MDLLFGFCSWFPFAIFNITSDLELWDISGETVWTSFMVTNLLGLSCTCTNPLLYGYFNQNIQEDLRQLYSGLQDKILESWPARPVVWRQKAEFITNTKLRANMKENDLETSL